MVVDQWPGQWLRASPRNQIVQGSFLTLGELIKKILYQIEAFVLCLREHVKLSFSDLDTDKITMAMATVALMFGTDGTDDVARKRHHDMWRTIRELYYKNESVTLLAETFFPDDRVDTNDPYRAEVRGQIDGDDQTPERSGTCPG
ncbi:hypothetical protein EVAR_55421_1 [Eumeta japonica]|uniref:Uncharacterized protein n=1 Tax=Eumeta variegata TaxID=151549 RepID=A0A4C1Z5D6_EUMVA|nr:hypothetical protein EVAR_55421_1 [Eumeta japonica]